MGVEVKIRGLPLNMVGQELMKKAKLFPTLVLKALLEEGVQYAKMLYEQHGHSEVDVSYEIIGNNKAYIHARDEAIAYFEFGTGIEGQQGNYQGKLPQAGVPITGSWVYYYESPYKATVNNVQGWYWGASFVTGRKPEAELWETSMYLRERMPIICEEVKRGK